jgi:hypothetical protein
MSLGATHKETRPNTSFPDFQAFYRALTRWMFTMNSQDWEGVCIYPVARTASQ